MALQWKVTHTIDQHVTYEIDFTKNGAPYAVPNPDGTSGAGSAGDAARNGGVTGDTVINLEPEQHYCFRVWTRFVENRVRSAVPSAWACADTPPHAPFPPNDVKAIIRPGQNRAFISWSTPDQSNHHPIASFEIDRQSPPGSNRPTILEGHVEGPNGAQATATDAR
jgi:hypothetical protein